MVHFIELTQIFEGDYHLEMRKIKVSVEQICFYYDKRIVFNDRAISVEEGCNEITELIKKAM